MPDVAGMAGVFHHLPAFSHQGFLTYHPPELARPAQQSGRIGRPYYCLPKLREQSRPNPLALGTLHPNCPQGALISGSLLWRFPSECFLGMLALLATGCAPLPQPRREMLLPEYLSLCLFFAGDAPFCTPEQHKECAEPALGQYWGTRRRG